MYILYRFYNFNTHTDTYHGQYRCYLAGNDDFQMLKPRIRIQGDRNITYLRLTKIT